MTVSSTNVGRDGSSTSASSTSIREGSSVTLTLSVSVASPLAPKPAQRVQRDQSVARRRLVVRGSSSTVTPPSTSSSPYSSTNSTISTPARSFGVSGPDHDVSLVVSGALGAWTSGNTDRFADQPANVVASAASASTAGSGGGANMSRISASVGNATGSGNFASPPKTSTRPGGMQ